MNRQRFNDLRDKAYTDIVGINQAKGVDYAGEDDALANFKEAAEALGLTPFQIWAVYHHKHQSAINQFIKRGRVESEPIEGRVKDAILYLFLLLGLIEDQKQEAMLDLRHGGVVADRATMSRALGETS